MITKGSNVRATKTWGYGKEIVTGYIDRDYLEGFDSNAMLTIWGTNNSFEGVIIDARFWEVEAV